MLSFFKYFKFFWQKMSPIAPTLSCGKVTKNKIWESIQVTFACRSPKSKDESKKKKKWLDKLCESLPSPLAPCRRSRIHDNCMFQSQITCQAGGSHTLACLQYRPKTLHTAHQQCGEKRAWVQDPSNLAHIDGPNLLVVLNIFLFWLCQHARLRVDRKFIESHRESLCTWGQQKHWPFVVIPIL